LFSKNNKKTASTTEEQFVEGVDYYVEKGLYVFTELYLKKRGYCCKNKCRHCPYGENSAGEQLST